MTTDTIDTCPAPTTVVLPAGSDLPVAEAMALDKEIDARLEACDRLLRSYLETGHRLAHMHDTKGYKALGFAKWGDYLDSKKQFGRTFLSYLLKLGRAGDPQRFLDLGLLPAVVINYIKAVGYPEKVFDLIEKTRKEVEGLSAKEANERIKEYMEVHGAEYSKPRKPRAATPALLEAVSPAMKTAPVMQLPAASVAVVEPIDWEERFFQEHQQLGDVERKRFVQAMRDFVDGCGPSN